MSGRTEQGAEVHWADAVAGEVLARGGRPVLSTGISPSGEIHIGNMREVLTADAVYRALRDRGSEPGFQFVSDDFDPLRKVYPFLDPAKYEQHVGRPLSEIPCPCGDHPSYADHFLQPFLGSLERLRIPVELVRASEMYKDGRMNRRIVEALRGRDRIVEILAELTGKEMGKDWSPFASRCPSCGRIAGTKTRGFSERDETVDVLCPCGFEGSVAMAGGGKLVWRVDWPARWKTLGVTVEPFGKDHSTRGGSYDTGVRIAREVFDYEPPFPVAYEWIRLKGRGDMSSSKGNVLSIATMLEVVPPEVLRYLVIREPPSRTIQFDPGLPLLQLVDRFDGASGEEEARAVALSRAGGFEAVGVPFRHLVVVAQAARFDVDRILAILERTGYPSVTRRAVESRIDQIRTWLERFAPEEVRFEVREELPDEARRLGPAQRRFLSELADVVESSDGLDDAALHDRIYEVASRTEGASTKELFGAIYLALLGKARGPRAAAFINVLGSGFCASRFRAAARDDDGDS